MERLPGLAAPAPDRGALAGRPGRARDPPSPGRPARTPAGRARTGATARPAAAHPLAGGTSLDRRQNAQPASRGDREPACERRLTAPPGPAQVLSGWRGRFELAD